VGDLDAFYDLHSRPEANRYLVWVPDSRDDAAAKLRSWTRARTIDPPQRQIRLAAVLADTGVLVGEVDLEMYSRANREGEVGYLIHPDHHGKGYATEAAAEMLRLGFEDFDLHRIVAIADGRNSASERVMQRIGMQREGVHRARKRVRDEWWDLLVYAILAEEWRSAH
jgi:RimJ/RimL family protein N-acetyltransferase